MISWVKELEKENIEDIDVKIGACTLYIFAKIAKADGNISKQELNFIKKKFHIHHKDSQSIDKFMHSESLDKKRNYIDEAKEIPLYIKNKTELRSILDGLAGLIWSDGKEHKNETSYFHKIAKIFGFNLIEADEILEIYRNG